MADPILHPALQPALIDHQHKRAFMDSVDTLAIQDGAVTSIKIADGTITTADLNSSLYGAVGSITTIDPDDTASAGVSTALARVDHQHAITAGTPAALTKTATSAESAGTGFARDVHVHATSNLPWGAPTAWRQVLTSNNGPHTTNATTDMSIASVAPDTTRLYVIHLSVLWNRSANGDWQVNVHAGGTLITEIGRLGDNAVGATKYEMSCLWLPSSSSSVTVDIRVVEVSGTADLTLLGGAGAERHFWIEDIGPR